MKHILYIVVSIIFLNNLQGQNYKIVNFCFTQKDSLSLVKYVADITFSKDFTEFKIPKNASDSLKLALEHKNDSIKQLRYNYIDNKNMAVAKLVENYIFLNKIDLYSKCLIPVFWKEYKHSNNARIILSFLNISKSQKDSILLLPNIDLAIKAKLGDTKALKQISLNIEHAIENKETDKIIDYLTQLLFINNRESIRIFTDVLASNKVIELDYTEGDYTYHKKIALSYFTLWALWVYNPCLSMFSPRYFYVYFQKNGIRKGFLEEYSDKEWSLYIRFVNEKLRDLFGKEVQINVPFLINGIYPIDPEELKNK